MSYGSTSIMTEVVPLDDKILNNNLTETENQASSSSQTASQFNTTTTTQSSSNHHQEDNMRKYHFCRCQAEWFVNDGLGITCSGITYFLILFAEFVVIAVILLPGFPLSVWSYLHAILFSILAFLAASSHLRAMTTNPVRPIVRL